MSVPTAKPPSPAIQFFFARIFPLLFMGAGASLLFSGLGDVLSANASADWPDSQGEVLASSIEQRAGGGGGSRGSTVYHAAIRYEFTVDDTTFTGDRVMYGGFDSSSRRQAQNLVDRYPVGESVSVYYLPENPEECLLEPGANLVRTWSHGRILRSDSFFSQPVFWLRLCCRRQ